MLWPVLMQPPTLAYALVRKLNINGGFMKKLISFFMSLLIAFPAWATTYYVDPSGSDSADGLTTGTAWATCTHAFAGSNTANGDSILFKSGATFPPGSCIVSHNSITMDIYGGTANAILNQTGITNSVKAANKTGTVINYLTGMNAQGDQFSIEASGDVTMTGVIADCNSITGSNDGFKQKDGTVTGTYTDIIARNCNKASNTDGISIHSGGTATITGFTAYGNTNGISNEIGTTLTVTGSTSHPCTIYSNTQAGARVAASGSGDPGVITMNNCTVNASAGGLGIGDASSSISVGTYNLQNVVVKGVTSGNYALSFLNAATTGNVNNLTIDNSDGGANILVTSGVITMKNVIMSNITSGQYFHFGGTTPVGRTVLSFCAFDKALASLSDQTSTFNSRFGSQYDLQFAITPHYLSQSTADYRLDSSSPLINFGVTISGRSTDIDGNSLFGIPDIGAYEYQSQISRINNNGT